MGRRLTCPEEELAGEIEFAVAVALARCPHIRLSLAAGRKQIAAETAWEMIRRAELGQSRMAMEDAPGKTR